METEIKVIDIATQTGLHFEQIEALYETIKDYESIIELNHIAKKYKVNLWELVRLLYC